MSEELFTSVPLVGYKFLSDIENIAYSRLVRAAYVKEDCVGWISKKDAISKLNFLKTPTIYKILGKLEEINLLEQNGKSYKVYVLSSTAKRENDKWVDTIVYLGDSNAYIGRKSLRLCTNRHRSLKNQLSQAVGVGEYRTPFYQTFRLKKGMKILLCTDGFDRRAGKYIHNLKSEKQIYHIYHFVQEQGEKDNISCIYLEWTKEEKHGR